MASMTTAPSTALGEVLEQACEEQHRQQHEHGVDHRSHLGPLSGRVGHRGLRQAAVGGEPTDQA